MYSFHNFLCSVTYYVYWLEGDHLKKVLGPVRRSDFQRENAHLLHGIAAAVADINGTLLDYSDNLCWEDTCETVNGQGEPVYADDDHIRAFSVRNYVSVLDQVVARSNFKRNASRH
ncbi:Aste57867_19659 [Aphanomyces stellatus]|uniref:Aste57867_19659 protein n=1 Tax=Aphanomyces stellatus TaxID=120398 RepID=A0A485LD45_9STRA|nr:hypothetical protein As57867_019594 [Aphanomyces stellatus]VFT96359.1 Aste57867_19659 [Aphanomyces stellatus]